MIAASEQPLQANAGQKRQAEAVAAEAKADSPEQAANKRQKIEGEKDGEGNTYFPISHKRRVTIKPFRGRMLIDIRETYEKADGSTGFGKKGISLTVEQFKELTKVMPTILETIEDSE